MNILRKRHDMFLRSLFDTVVNRLIMQSISSMVNGDASVSLFVVTGLSACLSRYESMYEALVQTDRVQLQCTNGCMYVGRQLELKFKLLQKFWG